jgi:hypothetical protein
LRAALIIAAYGIQAFGVDVSQAGAALFAVEALMKRRSSPAAMEDLRAARAEGSDNLSKAHAQTFATEEAMRDRFPDYRTRYKMRYP